MNQIHLFLKLAFFIQLLAKYHINKNNKEKFIITKYNYHSHFYKKKKKFISISLFKILKL